MPSTIVPRFEMSFAPKVMMPTETVLPNDCPLNEFGVNELQPTATCFRMTVPDSYCASVSTCVVLSVLQYEYLNGTLK